MAHISPPSAPPCAPGQSALDHLLEAASYGHFLVRIDEENGAYLAHHPDAVQHVLQQRHGNYASITPPKPLLGRRSLAMSHGEPWQKRRRLLQPLFQPRRLAAVAHRITEITTARCGRWRAAAGRGEAIAMDRELIELSLDTLLATLFGDDAQDGELKGRVHEAFEYFNARARQEKIDDQQLERSLEAMYGFLRGRLAARRGGASQEDDLLGGLLTTRDRRSGATLNDQDIIDELMMMMVMGHMSSAMGLTWTLYMLAQNPQAAQRLTDEVDTVLEGRVPGAGDLERLPQTCRFLEEVLRLYPPGWAFSRRAVAQDKIAGFEIPAGATVILAPWVTHRLAHLWSAPEVFDPERFTPARVARRHPFAYFPFGGGPRNCIGSSLAKMESRLILAQIAQAFLPALARDEPVHLEPNIALMPRGGLAMTLTPRS